MTTAVLDAVAEPKKAAAAKLTLPLRDLQSAMSIVALAAEKKTTIPVCAMTKIDGNTFTATNLDVSVRVTLAGVAGQGEAFLVPAHKLESFGKLLQGDTVTIAVDGTRATIRAGRSNTKVPVLPVANFPNVTFSDGGGLEISQARMERLLDFTAFAISKEESRYTLCGGLLVTGDGTLAMVATDGHRLARYTVPSDAAKSQPMLMPLKTLNVLGKVLDAGSKKPLSLNATADALFASVEGEGRSVALSSRKMTGQFPNYEAVIPTTAAVTLIVNAEEMLSALRRCSTFTDERSGAVRLTVSPTEMHLNGASTDTGETDETVDVRTTATFDAFKVGFCDKYLIEAFARLKGDVELRFKEANGQNAMMLVAHPEEGETFEYIVMPMRV